MVYLAKRVRISRSVVPLVSILFLAMGCSDGDNNSTFEVVKPQSPNPIVEEVTVQGGGPECCEILGGVVDLRDQNYIPGWCAVGAESRRCRVSNPHSGETAY